MGRKIMLPPDAKKILTVVGPPLGEALILKSCYPSPRAKKKDSGSRTAALPCIFRPAAADFFFASGGGSRISGFQDMGIGSTGHRRPTS